MKAHSVVGLFLLSISNFAADFGSDWKPVSPREEIRPTFTINKSGGPNHTGSLLIKSGDVEGEGYWQKTFSVEGGKFYEFKSLRHLEDIASPRRSSLVRIHWRDENNQRIKRDEPGAGAYAK